MKRLVRTALLAGLAGGLAEIAWVALYSSFTATSGLAVAREVTATVYPAAAAAPWSAWAGAGLHLVLSAALGIAFVLALWGGAARPGARAVWTCALSALVAIWALNFFVVLPAVNSTFITLMPLGATLTSKTLFGVAMAAVLQRCSTL